MKTDIQEAIQSCEERIRLYQERISKRIYKQNSKKRMQRSIYLDRVKIAALRAQQEVEKNEPLTLEELRKMDGEPVWVVIENDRPMLFLVDTKNPCQMMRDPEHGALSVLDIADYGEEWLAYRRKPKEDAGNGL